MSRNAVIFNQQPPAHLSPHLSYKDLRKDFECVIFQTSGLHINAFCITPINMITSF